MRDGATLVDKMIIGKGLLAQYDINAKTKWEIVFWDSFWGIDNMDAPSSANSMMNKDTMSDTEVLATLSGVQYKESKRTAYFGLAQVRQIQPLALQYSPGHKDQGHRAQLHLANTGTSAVFNLMCSSNV